jgi:hypothetical protein
MFLHKRVPLTSMSVGHSFFTVPQTVQFHAAQAKADQRVVYSLCMDCVRKVRYRDDVSTRCQFHLTPMWPLNGSCGDAMVHRLHGDDTNRLSIPEYPLPPALVSHPSKRVER